MANGLVTADQFQLVPDVEGSIGRGIGLASNIQKFQMQKEEIERNRLLTEQQRQSQLAALQKQQAVQGLRGQLLGAAPQQTPGIAPQADAQSPGVAQQPGIVSQETPQAAPGIPQAQPTPGISPTAKPVRTGNFERDIAQLFTLNPKAAEDTLNSIGLIDEFKRGQGAQFAFEASQASPERRSELIQRRAAQLQSEGRDPSDTLQLLDMPEDQLQQTLSTIQIAAMPNDERIKFQEEKTEKLTKSEKKERITKIEEETKNIDTRFERSIKLRNEIFKASTEFKKIRGSFGRIQASVEDPSGAGDLAVIFNFMKMLDPGSVVRESEQATAENARGVPDGIRNIWNRFLTAKKLTKDQRKDFEDRADKLFKRSKKDNDEDVDQIVSIGSRFGVPKADLLGEAEKPKFTTEQQSAIDAAKSAGASQEEIDAIVGGQ